MRKILAIFTAGLLLCTLPMPELSVHAEKLSGECGDNITYTLEDGVLTLTGTGETDNYKCYYASDLWEKDDAEYADDQNGQPDADEESAEDRETSPGSSEYYYYSSAPWGSEWKTIHTIRVGEGITSLGDALFAHCNAKTIELPESLTKIGESVFTCCMELGEITIPDSVTTIGSSAFSCCDKLSHVHLPKSLDAIPLNAFRYCRSLSGIDIPDSVTEIPQFAFLNCSSLTELSLPQGLTRIGALAFYGCTHLQDFQFPDSLETIEEEAFGACSSLTAANLPDSITEIGESAFVKCEKLETFHWPSGLDKIDMNMFGGCHIQELEIPPQVTKIGPGAFSDCPIRELVIPENVIYIGNGCFSETLLESVVLPETEIILTGPIFSGCGDLSVKFPKNCKKIPDYFFSDTGITEFTVPDTIESIGAYCFTDCTKLKKIVLPEGLKSIGDSAFHFCTRLEHVNFPDSLESLGMCAFSKTALTEVTIPEAVAFIRYGCFSFNSNLTKVILPDTKFKMEEECFAQCRSLRSVHLSAQCEEIPDGCFSNDYALTELEIPESCWRIGYDCFEDCTGLRRFTIPSGIREIGDFAFSSCLNLKHVTFSEGLQEIGRAAFEDVPLQEIILPESIELLSKECFHTCNPERLSLPDKRIKIEADAMPESWLENETGFVTLGGKQLFRYVGKEDETDIQVPAGISVIGEASFANTHAVSIALSDSVEEIEYNAFNPELEVLTIPASVEKIDPNAFVNSPNLREIRGDYFTPAHIFAVQRQIKFTPLHTEEDFGETVSPKYDTEILPFGNNGGVFGESLQLDPWHKAMLLDASRNLQLKDRMEEAWQGSCYGLSAVTVLTQCGLLSPSDLDPDAKTLHDVKPTQQAVELINHYQLSQYISPEDESEEVQTISQTFNACEAVLAARNVNHGKSPFIINIQTGAGGRHAVVGYGLESGEWEFDGKTYNRRVLLWDSNYSEPSDKVALYIDRDTLSMAFPAYNIAIGVGHSSSAGAILNVITDPKIINCIPFNSRKPLPGDADTNNAVTVSDAVLLARYLAEDTDISYCGEYNADLAHKGYLSFADINGIFRLVGTKN